MLVSALFAPGSAGAEQRAARQYAALLLNLAAGEQSAEMSYQVGLASSERLDSPICDTALLGPDVRSATSWMRAQLPQGALGGAIEVADAINNGHGLGCN